MITKVENVNKDSAFYQCMYGICDDVTQADEVVKLLEGISSSEPMPYPREFCISYVIKLLKKYCSADECELALARYGFLDGFERKNINGRENVRKNTGNTLVDTINMSLFQAIGQLQELP